MTKHQMLLNFDQKTFYMIDQLKSVVGTSNTYLISRILRIALYQDNDDDINRKLYQWLKTENYGDIILMSDQDYRKDYNVFLYVYLEDDVYRELRIRYNRQTNKWFTNFMRYCSSLVTMVVNDNELQKDILNYNNMFSVKVN